MDASTGVASFLVRQSWQIAAVFVVVAAACWMLRRSSAHWRYLLWLVVLGKCLVPPLVIVPLALLPGQAPSAEAPAAPEPPAPPAEWTAGPPAPGAETALTAAPAAPSPAGPDGPGGPPGPAVVFSPKRSDSRASPWLAVARWATIGWLGGAGAFLLLAALKAGWIQRRLRRSRRPAGTALCAEAGGLAGQLGMATAPRLWLWDGLGQPFVWGLVRGDVYLPGDFPALEPARSRRQVLAHELAHVWRCDAAVNALQVLVQGLFFFHPLVWWANRRIRREREKCCDEAAIAALASAPADYSRAIVEALLARREPGRAVPSLAVAGPVRNVEERIKTVMAAGRRFYRRPSRLAVLTAILLAAIALPTALSLTARAQKPPEADVTAPERAGTTRPASTGPGEASSPPAQRARLAAAANHIANLEVALDLFLVDIGRYPTSAEGLAALLRQPDGLEGWRGPYVRSLANDPWGRPYRYRCPGLHNEGTYDVWSVGPDGQEGSADDVTNWSPPPAAAPGAQRSDDEKAVRELLGRFLEAVKARDLQTIRAMATTRPAGEPDLSALAGKPAAGAKIEFIGVRTERGQKRAGVLVAFPDAGTHLWVVAAHRGQGWQIAGWEHVEGAVLGQMREEFAKPAAQGSGTQPTMPSAEGPKAPLTLELVRDDRGSEVPQFGLWARNGGDQPVSVCVADVVWHCLDREGRQYDDPLRTATTVPPDRLVPPGQRRLLATKGCGGNGRYYAGFGPRASTSYVIWATLGSGNGEPALVSNRVSVGISLVTTQPAPEGAATQPAGESVKGAVEDAAGFWVWLVDPEGKPLERQSLCLLPVSKGYSKGIEAGAFWADKEGKVFLKSLPPGIHRFVVNAAWPRPTFAEVRVPAVVARPTIVVQPREGEQPTPDLDVKVTPRREEGRLLLEVAVTNNTDRPYRLSATDLELLSVKHRVFPPATQAKPGQEVPPRGRGAFNVTLDWSAYEKEGLWCSRHDEEIRWRGPTEDAEAGLTYYRVRVGIAHSLPVPLPQPKASPDTVPAAPTTQPGVPSSDGPTAKVAATQPEKGFKAVLPSGVEIELVGLSGYPDKDQPWWRPDGARMQNPPVDGSDVDITSQQGPDGRKIELAFRLGGKAVQPGYESQISRRDGGFLWWAGRRTRQGAIAGELKVVATSVGAEEKVLDLDIMVAASPWRSEFVSDGRQAAGPLGAAADAGAAGGGAGRSTLVAAAFDPSKEQAAVVATDVNGLVHVGSLLGLRKEGPSAGADFLFRALPPEKIRSLCLQMRPYELVELRNVSLVAGQITAARVVPLALPTTTRPAGQPPADVGPARPAEGAEASAWTAYLAATDELLHGKPRGEVAKAFAAVAKRAPNEPVGQVASELAAALAGMAREDEKFVQPADPAGLSEKERLDWLVFRLRDVAERESDGPGKCQVLFYPRGRQSAAVQLRKLGKPAVPTLLGLLNDRRPTRSSGAALNGGRVLRYCDVALEILEAISCRQFDERTQRGAFLSTATEAERAQIISRVRQWWQQNQRGSEDQWIRQSLAETGVGALWSRLSAAERLIELEGPGSVEFFRQRRRSEPDNGHIVRLLWQAGGRAVLEDVRAAARSPSAEVQAAAKAVLKAAAESRPAAPPATQPAGGTTTGPSQANARVEGAMMFGGKPQPKMLVELVLPTGDPERPRRLTAVTDAEGRFVFPAARPGNAQLVPHIRLGSGKEIVLQGLIKSVELRADQTETVVFGGAGRPVAGQVQLPPEGKGLNLSLVRVRYWLGAPPFFIEDGKWPGGDEWGEFLKSDMGKGYKGEGIPVDANGRFRLEGVPAGHIFVQFSILRPAGGPVVSGGTSFVVDTMPGGKSDEPLDLGVLGLKVVAAPPAAPPATQPGEGQEARLRELLVGR